MQIADKGQKRLSGILLAVLVAIAARLMADILPVDFIGANVLPSLQGYSSIRFFDSKYSV